MIDHRKLYIYNFKFIRMKNGRVKSHFDLFHAQAREDLYVYVLADEILFDAA